MLVVGSGGKRGQKHVIFFLKKRRGGARMGQTDLSNRNRNFIKGKTVRYNNQSNEGNLESSLCVFKPIENLPEVQLPIKAEQKFM